MSRSNRSLWPIAAVLITGMLALLVYVITDKLLALPGQVSRMALKDLVTVRDTTVIASGVNITRAVRKLVVLDTTLDVEVTKDRSTSAFKDLIYLGTTTVRYRALDNRVQFFVPLELMTESDFSFDASRQTLTVLLPRPRLDEDMIVVQSDPKKVLIEISPGWSATRAGEGERVRLEAQAALRPALIRRALADARLRERADEEAIVVFKQDFAVRLTAALGRPVTLDVKYRP